MLEDQEWHLRFEEEYFRSVKYSQRGELVRRHVLELIRWGSKVSRQNLLNGLGKTALDIGCAYGYSINILESLGYKTYGADISRHAIRRAKANCVSCTGNFIVCDAQAGLPFKAAFDLITCFDVLEHLENPLKAIENMISLCKGVLLCTTPNKAVEKPIRSVMKDCDKTHISVKFPSEWEKCLREKFPGNFIKVDTFYDLTLMVANKLLLFKSVKIPYFGLTSRILIRV
ncbi:MAG: class I SAM-dependent methyltransferase [Candidatus Bathyarchaeia archaeon]